jgi:hypothetical protein
MPDASTAQADPITDSLKSQFQADSQTPENLLRQQFAKDTAPGFNPLSWATSFVRGANAVGTEAIAGLAGVAADTFDPSARFADQNNAQIQDAIDKSQAEIASLQEHLKESPNDFTNVRIQPRLLALQGDIAAAQRQLEKRTPGGQATTTPGEATGDFLLGLEHRAQQATRIIRGEEAAPAANAWDQVNNFMNRLTLAAPPPDVLHRNDPVSQFAEQFGQMVGMAPLAGGGLPAEAAAFGGQSSEAERENARQAGGNLHQQAQAAQGGFMNGLLQSAAAHYVFGALLPESMPATVGELRDHIIRSAGVGAVTGGAQQVASNLIAQTSQYDPKRKLTDGLWDSIWKNSLVMGLTGAAVAGPSFALRAISGKTDLAVTTRTGPAPEAPRPGEPVAPAPTAGDAEAERARQAADLQAQLAPKPEAGEPAPTPAPTAAQPAPAPAPEAADAVARIQHAYENLSAQRGRRSVPIADVLGWAGVPMDEGRAAIQALGDRVQLDTGDWASATEAHRAAAIEQGGRPRLYMALEEPAAAPQPEVEPAAKQAASDPTEAPARRAAAPPTALAPEAGPMERGSIMDVLRDIRDRLGPRFVPRVWNQTGSNIPMRYRADMRARGLDPSQVIGFTDKATGDFWVNPNVTPDELYRTVTTNGLPESLRSKFNVVPIASYQDHADSPGVARMLQRFPDADQKNPAVFDPASGNILLNAPYILAHADPVGEAIRSVTHEAAGHMGIRSQFEGNVPAYNAFLDRAWAGLMRDGRGDQIAAKFGTNMQGLARQYDLIGDGENLDALNAPDRANARRRLAEEMVSRYAEDFDPAELNRAPNVIQRAVGLIRDGFSRNNGLNFDNGEAFDFLRNAYRGIEPDRAVQPADQEALAKRLGQVGYGTILESAEDTANNRADIDQVADGVRRPKREVGATLGEPASGKSIQSSAQKLARFVAKNPDYALTPERVDQERLGDPIGKGAEHTVSRTRGDHVLVETDPEVGPYGIAPALPDAGPRRRPDTIHTEWNNAYGYTAAHPDQYLQSLAIRNQLWPDFQTHLEGFVQYPGDEHPRIVTSRPLIDAKDYHPSDYEQRNEFFGDLGFKPLDDRAYYNSDKNILLNDMHGNNVRVSNADPSKYVVIDGFASQPKGALLNHVEDYLENGGYQQWLQARNQGELAGRNAALQFNMGVGPEFETREPTSAELRAEEAVQREQEGKTDPWSFLDLQMKREEGGVSEERRKAMQLSMYTALESGGAKGFSEAALAEQARAANPEAVKIMAASPDMWLFDREGRPIWNQQVSDIYSRFGGDVQKVSDYWFSPQFERDNGRQMVDYMKGQLAQDVRSKIVDAMEANDTARVQQLTNALGNIYQRYVETGTEWGQQGVARQLADPLEAFTSQVQAEVRTATDRAVNQSTNFRNARDEVYNQLRQVNNQLQGDVAKLTRMADAKQSRNQEQSLPDRLADALAKDVTEAARNAKAGPKQLGALNGLFADFKTTVGQLFREQGIDLTPKQRGRATASATMLDALNNMPWFKEAWDRTVAEAQDKFGDDPDMQHAFALADQAFQVPFSGTQVRRAISELKMPSISDLVMQHRTQTQAVIDTLSDYLVKNSELSRPDADAVQKAVDTYVRTAVGQQRQAELDRVLDQYGGKDPSGRPVSMNRLINLIHMGAFDDKAVADALAPSFGLKSVTPELQQTFRDLTDKLAQYERDGRKGFQTQAIRYQLSQALKQWQDNYLNGAQRASRTGMSVFMGNILSGPPTHAVAVINDAFTGWGNIASRWWALPNNEARAAAIPRIMSTWMDGFVSRGLPRAAYIWDTGIDPTKMGAEMQAGGRVEQELPNWLKPYRYVFRSITAAHALMASAPERTTAWLYAFDQASRDPNTNLDQAIGQADTMINGGPGELQAAQQRASSEGLTQGSTEWKLRTQELLDQRTPEAIRSVGQMYGTRSIFTQAPEGIIGSLARSAQTFTREQPWGKFIVPFTNIVANVLNESINYSPLGFTRYGTNEFMTDWKHFRQADRNISEEHLNMLKADMLTKATVGTGLLAGIWASQNITNPANGRPILQIHGAGPSDPSKRGQLMDAGWSPFSVQLNMGGNQDVYLPFEYTPIAVGLGMIGGAMDAQRYEKFPDVERSTMYAMSNMGSVVLDRTFLRGAKQFLDAMTGSADPREAVQNVREELRSMSSFVPYAGALGLQQLFTQFVDRQLYQGGAPIVGDMLRNVPMMNYIDGSKPRLNLLGEPIEFNPELKRFVSVGSSDPVWQFLHENNVFLEDPRNQKLQGKTMSQEQMYNFMAARGPYLREALASRLDQLQSLNETDPKRMDDQIKSLESAASRRAKADIIRSGAGE